MKQIEETTRFIRDYFYKTNRRKAIVGLSGGLDSSVVCLLCAKALGPKFVYPVFMPYQPFTSKKSLENVKKIVKLTKISPKNLIIEEITNQINVFKKKHPQVSKIDLGNKICRERMSLLYYYARKIKGLVVGTSNRSELLLGYFTLHGDGAWDIAPVIHLYKTEVKKLAKSLKIPREIINQIPSAGLWLGQKDEEELGFSYQIADKILAKLVDQNMSPEQIEKTGISKEIISRVFQRHQENRFKLKFLPRNSSLRGIEIRDQNIKNEGREVYFWQHGWGEDFPR